MAGRLLITLEIVTPLFLGGADAASLADAIRVSAIRGQLRYWLRALLGREHGEDIEALQKQEGNLMGSTEAGSTVLVRVQEPKSLLRTVERMMLPHRQLGEKPPLRNQSFAEDQLFQLVISPRPGLSEIPDSVMAALLLWLNLGGLGKRSRRGFGSFQVREINVEGLKINVQARELLQAQGKIKNGAELQTYIEKVVTWCVSMVPRTAVFSGLAPYPVLFSTVANVTVCEAAPGNKEATKRYQQAMVPFWIDTLRSDDLADKRAYGFAIGQDRRASPFHLHMAKTDAGYHLVLTTFWSKPSPDGDTGWGKMNLLLLNCQKQWGGKTVWGREIK